MGQIETKEDRDFHANENGNLKTLNKIYNMNCLVGLKRMKEDSVSCVITSPPYNRKRNDKYENYEDVLSDKQYKELLYETIEECMRVSCSYVFFNIQKNYYNKEIVFSLFSKYSKQIVEVIIWGKNNPMPASGKSITNSYEFIFVFSTKKSSLKSYNTYTKNLLMTSVYSNNPYKKVHKAVMKPDVVEFLLKNFTLEGDVVLDPFMGVGTTGAMCKLLHRNYIGFEISEEYCQIAEDRLANTYVSTKE